MSAKLMMPKLGLTMVKGTIIKWIKKEGDYVEKDEIIVEVQSDKSSFEVEAPASGFIKKIYVEEDATVPVGTVLAIITAEGENLLEVDQSKKTTSQTLTVHDVMPSECTRKSSSNQIHGKEVNAAKIKISPRARRLVRENNLNVIEINGSGPNGRIVEKDVKNILEQKVIIKTTPLAVKVAAEFGVNLEGVKGSGINGRIYKSDIVSQNTITKITDKKEPYKGMRRVIGERLSLSKFTAPHVYFTFNVEMSSALKIKESRKAIGEKISINDILIYVVSHALEKHPELNAAINGEEIFYFNNVNIGMAVAVEKGLIVPVIRSTQQKRLSEIAKEAAQLAVKARENNLLPEDYQGGTFTISNLGMTGVDSFTAIINPPEAAILAVGGIKKKSVVNEKTDEIEIKPMMKITLSVDHRIVDGYTATQFLKTVKEYLEDPYQLL